MFCDFDYSFLQKICSSIVNTLLIILPSNIIDKLQKLWGFDSSNTMIDPWLETAALHQLLFYGVLQLSCLLLALFLVDGWSDVQAFLAVFAGFCKLGKGYLGLRAANGHQAILFWFEQSVLGLHIVFLEFPLVQDNLFAQLVDLRPKWNGLKWLLSWKFFLSLNFLVVIVKMLEDPVLTILFGLFIDFLHNKIKTWS